MSKCIKHSWSYQFAALQFGGSVRSQFVVQVVEMETKGGRSLIKGHMKARSELRHVQRLWCPDCKTQEIRTLNSHDLLDIAIKQVQEEPFKKYSNLSEM